MKTPVMELTPKEAQVAGWLSDQSVQWGRLIREAAIKAE